MSFPPRGLGALGRLNGTSSSIACHARGNGIFTLASGSNDGSLVTTSSVLNLQRDGFGAAQGYSLAIWLQQEENFTDSRTLFSIESLKRAYSNEPKSCEYNLKIDLVANHGLHVRLCELRSDIPGIMYDEQKYDSLDLRGDKIHHLVASFSFANNIPIMTIYVDGSLAASWPLKIFLGKFRPRHWDGSFHAKLLPPYLRAAPLWPGSIYSLGIFNNTLSLADVGLLYHAGLPNSLPVVESAALAVQENGEVGDHALDPAFYSAPIPAASLATLTLPAYDQDDLPSSPNYRVPMQELPRMRVWIQRLPTEGTGTLYYLNGTAIGACPAAVPYDGPSGSYLVRFRPALDVYSSQYVSVSRTSPASLASPLRVVNHPNSRTNFPLPHPTRPGQIMSSFTFFAQDGVTMQVTGDATVSVSVTRVDKPPVATAGLSSNVTAGVRTLLPTMTGHDADGDETIVHAFITALPTKGSLYAVYPNGSVSSRDLTLGSSSPSLLLSLPNNSFAVAYKYTGTQNVSTSAEGRLAGDVVWFALADSHGRKSVPRSIGINVFSPLVALPASSPWDMPLQGVQTIIPVSGKDVSSALGGYDVRVQVMSLPASGTLSWAQASLVAIGVGAKSPCTFRLPSMTASPPKRAPAPAPRSPTPYPTAAPSSSPCQLLFKSDPASFSVPNRTATVPIPGTATALIPQSSRIPQAVPDSFSFRLVAADSGAASAVVTQRLRVRDVNKPTEISYSSPTATPLTVYAVSRVDDSQGIQAHTHVTGFALWDPDLGVDLVRVRVYSARHASLTLNEKHIASLDFISQVACRSSKVWQCKGSGFGNRDMSFVARPDVAEAALNGLRYESITPNVIDNVTVTVYDGQGGQCLNNNVNSQALRSACFSRTAFFTVTVLGFADFPASRLNGVSAATADRIKYIGALALLCCCLCTCAMVRRRLQRCCGRGGKDREGEEERDGDQEGDGEGAKEDTALVRDASDELDWTAIYPGRGEADMSLGSERDSPPLMQVCRCRCHCRCVGVIRIRNSFGSHLTSSPNSFSLTVSPDAREALKL